MTKKIYLAPSLNIYEPTVLIDPYTGIANHSLALDKWITDGITDGTIVIPSGPLTVTGSYITPNLTLTVGSTTLVIPIPDTDAQNLSVAGTALSISNGNSVTLDISNIRLTQPVTINNISLNNTNTLEELVNALNGNFNSYQYYVHTQTVPSNIWVISTGLNRPAAITVTDSAGTIVYGEYTRSNTNPGDWTLMFSAAFSGTATFN